MKLTKEILESRKIHTADHLLTLAEKLSEGVQEDSNRILTLERIERELRKEGYSYLL